jgi:hypothetical protein
VEVPAAAGGRPAPPGAARPAAIPLDPRAAVASVGRPTAAHVGYAAALLDGLSSNLSEAAREPFSARAVVYALLLDPDEAVSMGQLRQLETHAATGTAVEVLRLLPAVRSIDEAERLPLVELTFPALRRLSEGQYREFRQNVNALVKADRRVSLFEFALLRMLLRHLDRAFFGAGPIRVRYRTLDSVFEQALLLVSSLARLGQGDEAGATRAFVAGMARLQGDHPGERRVSLLPAEKCSVAAVDRALERLAQAVPEVKRRVLDASAATIVTDGVVTTPEAELLRAIADSLDCPMPPLLAPATTPGLAHARGVC